MEKRIKYADDARGEWDKQLGRDGYFLNTIPVVRKIDRKD